jgi:Phosphate-starvation-inducible E family
MQTANGIRDGSIAGVETTRRHQDHYQRFESLIAFILTLIVTLVTLAALYRLVADVVGGLVFGALNPLDYRVFQTVFGEIMTVLIALEFNHTLQYVVSREQSIKSSCSFPFWLSHASSSSWISKRRHPMNCWV